MTEKRSGPARRKPGNDTVEMVRELAAVMKKQGLSEVIVKTRDAEIRLLPVAAERGVAVIVNQPFETGGMFRRVRGRNLPGWAAEFDCASWAQLFLKYLLADPAVTCVIPATGKPEHMKDNLKAGFGRLPDAATRERIRRFWATL